MKAVSRGMISRTAKFVPKPIRNMPRKLSRSAGRVFRLVEFREDRLYASQEVGAGVG
jgi:hypothetical protein